LQSAICNSSRSGAVIVIAMICLLLSSVLAVSLVKLALAHREQIDRDVWQLQAEWLAEAGLDRAAARLHSEADYRGEVWAPDLTGALPHAARIEISVEPRDGDGATAITVVSDYPDDAHERVRVRKSTILSAVRTGQP
jgi:type II secretory pathway component PulK